MVSHGARKSNVDVGTPPNSRLRVRSNSVGSAANSIATAAEKAKWSKVLGKCPCQKSDNDSFKIQCVQCRQKWHMPCANMSSKSISEKTIEEMEKTWACPWCYISPLIRPAGHPSLKCESKLLGTVVSVAVHEKLSETFDHQIEEICLNTNRIIGESLKAHSDKIAEELKRLEAIKVELLERNSDPVPSEDSVSESIQNSQLPLYPQRENPCKNVDNYIEKFIEPNANITKDLISTLGKLKFSKVNGREVASFGEEYQYTGAPRSNIKEIPPQLEALIAQIKSIDEYSAADLNQIVINKYVGEDSFLPEHSDNESTIKPESNIFTLTLGTPRTVIFGDKCNGETKEITPDTNSLYVMSQQSQLYWSHRIDKEPSDLSTRYSITLRSVGKNYKNATVIIGDSNTKHLKFSQGKAKEIGTFGYMLPGKRVEAFHVRDIDPLSCIGYRNVVLHCGINDIRDRSPGRLDTDPEPSDVEEHFNNLITKVRQIKELCPYISIFISPILPTKSLKLNQRVVKFNKLIMHYSMHDNASEGVRIINLEQFVSDEGVLIENLGVWDTQNSCYNNKDILHLGKLGIRLLAKLFRENIFHKQTTSRPYSSVLSPTISRPRAPHTQ